MDLKEKLVEEDFLGSNKDVVRGLEEGDERSRAHALEEDVLAELVAKEGKDVHGEIDIVVREPKRPEGASSPALRRHAFSRILASNVKVHDGDNAARRQQGVGVLNGSKPVGDHGKGVSEGNERSTFLALRGNPSGGVALNGLNILPSVFFNSLASHCFMKGTVQSKS